MSSYYDTIIVHDWNIGLCLIIGEKMKLTRQEVIFLTSSVLLLTFLIISPVLNSGYAQDDTLNSLIPGSILEQNINLYQFVSNTFTSMINNMGRFYPLSIVCAFAFLLFNNLIAYKIYLILLICVNILLFGYWIKLLTNSTSIGILSTALIPIFLQMRFGHDPIISYAGLIQIVFIFLIASLILFFKYIKTHKNYYFILSLITYCACLLTYEISYPFLVLFLFLIFYFCNKESKKHNVILSLAYGTITVVVISIPILIRIYGGYSLLGNANSPPYTPNIDLFPILKTLFNHVISSVPLSHLIFDPGKEFSGFNPLLPQIIVIGIIITVIYLYLWTENSNHLVNEITEYKTKYEEIKALLFIGIFLLVLPGVIISLSPRYQKEITLGYSHLPIYISYFGLSLILLFFIITLYLKILNNANEKNNYLKIITILIAISLGITGSLTYSSNVFVIEKSNYFWLYPRAIIENGINTGLFAKVPNESTLYIESNYPWDNSAFFRMNSGIHFNHVGGSGTQKYAGGEGYISTTNKEYIVSTKNFEKLLITNDSYSNSFYLNYYSIDSNEGYAILSNIHSLVASDSKIFSITSNQSYIYAYLKDIKKYNPGTTLIITGNIIKFKNTTMNKPFILTENKLTLISEGMDYKLLSLTIEDSEYDPKSIVVYYISKYSENSIYINNIENLGRADSSSNNADIINISLDDGYFGNGLDARPISLGENYSIEIIATPFENSSDYSTIISNHPGFNYFEGFTIAKIPGTQNEYSFGYGTGKSWSPALKIKLNASELTYLVINGVDTNITVYQNGRKTIEETSLGNRIKNSDMPLTLGNWNEYNRRFNGLLWSVRISNRTINENEIDQRWKDANNNSLYHRKLLANI